MSYPRAALALMVVYLALLGLMRIVGDAYCALWLPLLRVELNWLLPNDALMDVGMATRHGERVYVAQIALEKMPSGTLRNGQSRIAMVSCLSGNAVQPPIIVLSLVLSNIRLKMRQRGLAGLLALAVIAMLFAIDLPLVLAGAVDDLMRENALLERGGASHLTRYGSALDRGGRLALAVLGAYALIGCVARRRDGRE